MAIVWKKVKSKKNSACDTARLKELNFGDWWSDNSFNETYIHVASKDKDTSHRVFCREHTKPRLGYRHGELYWIYDDGQY